MHPKTWFSLGACLALFFAGCGRKSSDREGSGLSAAKLDACQLLTKQEIEAVQGSPIIDTKSSEQSNGRIRTAQCYFGAEQSNRSVSLTLTQADPAAADRRGARKFWEETFGRFENEDKGKEKEKESDPDEEKKKSLLEQKGKKGEEEEESAPPKKIEGIGEEAFWSGNRVGGALYVLKKDFYLRISLGGPDKEEARIDKSKALAQKILDRL